MTMSRIIPKENVRYLPEDIQRKIYVVHHNDTGLWDIITAHNANVAKDLFMRRYEEQLIRYGLQHELTLAKIKPTLNTKIVGHETNEHIVFQNVVLSHPRKDD